MFLKVTLGIYDAGFASFVGGGVVRLPRLGASTWLLL
jgi:hypothetical protein